MIMRSKSSYGLATPPLQRIPEATCRCQSAVCQLGCQPVKLAEAKQGSPKRRSQVCAVLIRQPPCIGLV